MELDCNMTNQEKVILLVALSLASYMLYIGDYQFIVYSIYLITLVYFINYIAERK